MLKILKLIAKSVIILLFLVFNLELLARSYVVIIPSYNNIKWYQKNLDSVLSLEVIPDKISYRVIYIDDCSTDGTGEAVEQYLRDWKLNSGSQLDVTVVHNNLRHGAMSNWYRAIHSCRDDEVVISLDGDDWLAHKKVLLKLEHEYAKGCWLTYGQWMRWPDRFLGRNNKLLAKNMPIRKQKFSTSHLRTFYAGLFKQVKLKDFLDTSDKFYAMACDVALMWPMLELCGAKHKLITNVLYIYNFSNPISDERSNRKLQDQITKELRSKSSYVPAKTYRADLLKPNLKYLIIDQSNYNLELDQLIANCSHVIFNLSPDNLNLDLTAEDLIKELNFLQQTGLNVIMAGDNTEIIGKCELVSPININNNNLNHIYVTRAKNLLINNFEFNNFKYLILTRENYLKLVKRNRSKNSNCNFNSFIELSAKIINGLVQKNDLVLLKIM